MIKKKHFIFGTLIGLVLLFSYLFTLPDGKLHLVFCNVGQGDAAYIRTPANLDMLIDGGPNDKILSCLGKHMPFYDRTIDVVVLSHPQADHMKGLISVTQRYNVKYFVIGIVGSESETYKQMIEEINKRHIPVKHLYQDDQFSLGEVKFSVLWPEKEWVAEHTLDLTTGDASGGPPISAQDIGSEHLVGVASGRTRKLESGLVLGLKTSNELNDFSFYLHLTFGTFDALFTGDGDSRIQPEIMKKVDLPDVEVLKFPHHGSKYGALPEFLDLVKPELSVISVGKNPWGHPTSEALKLLSDRAIQIKRTDREGDIEIVSDGRSWSY